MSTGDITDVAVIESSMGRMLCAQADPCSEFIVGQCRPENRELTNDTLSRQNLAMNAETVVAMCCDVFDKRERREAR